MFWEEKERKPIPRKVKQRVFERAKGRCENPECSRQLEWGKKDLGI